MDSLPSREGVSRRDIFKTYSSVIAVGASSGFLASRIPEDSSMETAFHAADVDSVLHGLVSDPESDISSAIRTKFAALGLTNVFNRTQKFAAAEPQALDYSGTVHIPEAAQNAQATYVYRAAAAIKFVGGSNGVRGDAVSSNQANSGGASFGNVHATFVEHDGGFKGKGSIHGYYHRGVLGENSEGAYGELGGAVFEVTNNRPGGLVEAAELKVNIKTAGRSAALVSVLDAGVDSEQYWSRGHWIVSSGSEKADEAIYISGSGGWKDYLSVEDSQGGLVFRVDGSGTLRLGEASVVPRGTGLDFSGALKATNVNATEAVRSPTWINSIDSGQMVTFGSGDPNGVVVAAPGSLFLNAGGGSRRTLWAKESGTGSDGWVGK